VDEVPNAELTPDQVVELDALYVPFPPASEWPDLDGSAKSIWDKVLADLVAARDAAGNDSAESLGDEILRIAAIDTGAIEGLYSTDRGFTFSVARMEAAWETELRETKGADVAAHVKAQLEAYEYAVDLASAALDVSATWIREVHAVASAAQQHFDVRTVAGPQRRMLNHGEYKHDPNHVRQADGTIHAHAPVEDVEAEILRLVDELRSPAFSALHPVAQAAYAHYGLVRIHPFADGNGRVSRVLASVYILRATSLPLVVLADQRLAYYDALEATDRRSPATLNRFVLDRMLDVSAYAATLLTATDFQAPDPRDELLDRWIGAVERMTPVHPRPWRLQGAVVNAANRFLEGFEEQPAIALSLMNNRLDATAPAGWRIHNLDADLQIEVRAEPPLIGSATGALVALEAELPPERYGVLWSRGGPPLTVRPDELGSPVSDLLIRRIEVWIRARVTDLCGEVLEQVRAAE
jgi:hypothetical protein